MLRNVIITADIVLATNNGLAGVIHKGLLAGAVLLAQHDVQIARPVAIHLAEPAIVVAFWIGLMLFFPQQLQGDVLPAHQFLMDDCEIRQGPASRCRRRWRWEHPLLQGGIIQLGG